MSLTPAQIEQRKGLITASEAASVLGLNPYKSRHQYWAEKVGEAPKFEENFRSRRGHAVEPLLLAWLGEQIAPLHVRPSGDVTLTHPILTWLGATPDALVFEDDAKGRKPVAIGEAKSSALVGDWTDEVGSPTVPDYYLPQVVVQMAVTGAARAYVVAELLDPRESEPWIVTIERDRDLEAIVLEECDFFRRNYVVTRVPPPFDDESTYRDVATVFRRVRKPELVPASATVDKLAREYLEAVAARKAYDEIAKARQAKICAEIKDAKGIAGETWRATWDERAESQVAYTRKPYRHFDLREFTRKEATT